MICAATFARTAISKRLTTSIIDRVLVVLHTIIGIGNIGKPLEFGARHRVVGEILQEAYAAMAADNAHEAEAHEWCEAFIDDGLNETWCSPVAGFPKAPPL